MNKQPAIYPNELYVQLKDPDEIRVICIQGKKSVRRYLRQEFTRIGPRDISFTFHCFTNHKEGMIAYRLLFEEETGFGHPVNCAPILCPFVRGLENPIIDMNDPAGFNTLEFVVE